LEKPLRIVATQAKVVALIHAPGVALLQARHSGLWEGHDHAAHKGEQVNPHIWLDPVNARAMVMAIAAALKEADSANAARYDANATALAARLDALDRELKGLLTPVKDKPFVVFHDAYPYFEARYGLHAVGAVTVSPDRVPGARRVQEIRAKIESLQTVCVFAEPQFQPALIQTLVDGTRAKVGTLDPEGATLTPGADLYFVLMRELARHVSGCLK
jgi:zinc transport system substrate-binding protein